MTDIWKQINWLEVIPDQEGLLSVEIFFPFVVWSHLDWNLLFVGSGVIKIFGIAVATLLINDVALSHIFSCHIWLLFCVLIALNISSLRLFFFHKHVAFELYLRRENHLLKTIFQSQMFEKTKMVRISTADTKKKESFNMFDKTKRKQNFVNLNFIQVLFFLLTLFLLHLVNWFYVCPLLFPDITWGDRKLFQHLADTKLLLHPDFLWSPLNIETN